MKNKRKYEDTVPANAENISKKNLNKLRKLTKPGNPVVKELRMMAYEFLADRKNSNNLLDILSRLEASEPSSVATAAVLAAKRCFTTILERNQLQMKEGEAADSVENVYRAWLQERFQQTLDKLVDLLHHKKTRVVQLAISTLMGFIQVHKSANPATKGWSSESIKILQTLVLGICSNKLSGITGLNRFCEFFRYSDVSYQFVSILSRLVPKVVKNEKASLMFVDNTIACLETFQMPDEKTFSKMPKFLIEGEASNDDGKQLSYSNLRKNFGIVWTSLLKCKFNLDQYKRTLILLNEKVIPLLPKPLLLTDFLLGCFSVGGAISMLALSGVFTLINEYNLDYPDFYTKLYELFTVEIFFVKYKARFFHMSDIFLSSTHLPVQLVASFVKRLARLSLQAPSESLPMCIKFIHNLIHRHRGLTTLLDAPEKADLKSDPFLAEEPDPSKTCAVDSSLWEIKTLASHILPEVSSVARDLVEKGVRESEKDMSSSLETGYADLMEAELKKKVFVNVPVTWESPTGLRVKGDLFSQLFDIA